MVYPTFTPVNMHQEKPKITPEDFYYNDKGYRVFKEIYHLKRGYCCKNGCLHCPYGYDKATDLFIKKTKDD